MSYLNTLLFSFDSLQPMIYVLENFTAIGFLTLFKSSGLITVYSMQA